MTHSINLNHITKIEGHANLAIEIENNEIKKCELSSIEGSRYFEGLLKGKRYYEAHEISSRICGVCSCAHNVAATTAMERALGIKVTNQTNELKKLLTLGERVRSHAAHLYFLALPDYMGYESAIAMVGKFREEVKSALHMMKFGNEVVRIIGGRDLHPVSITVGGFLHIPAKEQLSELIGHAKKVKYDAIKTVQLFQTLKLYEITDDCEHFCLHDNKEYGMLSGVLMSEKAMFTDDKYLEFFKEYHSAYSTANFVTKDDKSFMVGALSRMNLNRHLLSKDAKKLLDNSGIGFPNKNPFTNNFCQAIELVHCIDHIIEICKRLEPKPEYIVKPENLKQGRGVAAIEVPRGLLFHDYTVDDQGIITHANIITPTAQNLKNMEDNIRKFLPRILELNDEEKINLEIEKLIRAYDPCFSCSTHFLKVKWNK
ncbi:MAG: Ni/Fe hydrogenase subunit alpha [archaeon]